MGIEKTRLLAQESIYWISVNGDTENTVQQFSTCLGFQWMQLKEKTPHEIQGKPLEVKGANLFIINNSTFLCVVDYHKNPSSKMSRKKNYQQIA